MSNFPKIEPKCSRQISKVMMKLARGINILRKRSKKGHSNILEMVHLSFFGSHLSMDANYGDTAILEHNLKWDVFTIVSQEKSFLVHLMRQLKISPNRANI